MVTDPKENSEMREDTRSVILHNARCTIYDGGITKRNLGTHWTPYFRLQAITNLEVFHIMGSDCVNE